MKNTYSIELTQVAFEFLRKLAEEDNVIAQTLKTSSGREIKVGRTGAEEFCDRLTELLATIGFDENYELTTAGRLIEGIIGRFDTR